MQGLDGCKWMGLDDKKDYKCCTGTADCLCEFQHNAIVTSCATWLLFLQPQQRPLKSSDGTHNNHPQCWWKVTTAHHCHLRTSMTAHHHSKVPTTTIVNEWCQHPATWSRNHAQRAWALSHKCSPPPLRPNKPLAAWGWDWITTSVHRSSSLDWKKDRNQTEPNCKRLDHQLRLHKFWIFSVASCDVCWKTEKPKKTGLDRLQPVFRHVMYWTLLTHILP